MAAVPVIPAFDFQDSHLFRLQQLSAAVSFAVRCPVVFHLYKTGTQAITAGVNTALTWSAAMADSDSGWSNSSSTRYTAQTPGYFHMDYGVNGTTGASDNSFAGYMQVTTGPNNPAGAGVQQAFGAHRDDTGTSASVMGLSASSMSPYLYIGDFVEVLVSSSQNTTVSNSWNTSGNNDLNGFPDGGAYFTGMLWSLGP